MPISIFTHLGQDIWIIHSMPWLGGTNPSYATYSKPEDGETFENEIKREIKRNLFAFTANRGQVKNGEILERNGFKKIITFNSSHIIGDEAQQLPSRETITLWRKYNKRAEKNPNAPIGSFTGNCSIANGRHTGRTDQYRCIFKIRKPDEPAPEGFIRIGKSLFYIKINGSKFEIH